MIDELIPNQIPRRYISLSLSVCVLILFKYLQTTFDCEHTKAEGPSSYETHQYSNAVQTAASVFKKVVLKKRLENNEYGCGDGKCNINIFG